MLYLQLQRIYQKQAAIDTAAVMHHTNAILTSLGRQAGSIPAATVQTFCKQARSMRIVRYKTLKAEVLALFPVPSSFVPSSCFVSTCCSFK